MSEEVARRTAKVVARGMRIAFMSCAAATTAFWRYRCRRMTA
jgi:hypothetical protein